MLGVARVLVMKSSWVGLVVARGTGFVLASELVVARGPGFVAASELARGTGFVVVSGLVVATGRGFVVASRLVGVGERGPGLVASRTSGLSVATVHVTTSGWVVMAGSVVVGLIAASGQI